MAKRKRNSEGNELAQGGRLKRVKEQEQIEIKSEAENVGTLPVNANQLNDPGSSQLQGSEDEVALARKIEKHKRRKLKRVRKAALHAQDVVKAEKGDEVVELKHTKIQKSRKRNQILDQQQNGRRNEDQAWEISKPVGGRMTGIDPIFSPDEEYLLIAYDSAIIVYSTATSLPVRSLRVKEADNISAFSLSSHNTQQLYISTTLGMIEKWDWTQGSRLGHWKLSSSIYFLTTSVQAAGEAGRDLVYTVDRKGSNPWLISVHHLTDSSRNEVKTLFSSDKALSYMKVMEGGRFIIATSGARLIIGSSSPPDPAILQNASYTWRIVDSPDWIVSVDARVSHLDLDRKKIEGKKSKGGSKKIESLDIAIGGLKGSIHVYQNLLGDLIHREQLMSKDGSEDIGFKGINSRRLHWHRNAVLALKWSLDGECAT